MGSASIERGARRWISEVRSICPSVLLLHSSYCTVELRYKVLLLRMDPQSVLSFSGQKRRAASMLMKTNCDFYRACSVPARVIVRAAGDFLTGRTGPLPTA